MDWDSISMRLYKPSLQQVRRAISQLRKNHVSVCIRESTPTIVNAMSSLLLNVTTVTAFSIQKTSLTLHDQIDCKLLASNKSLEHLSISYIDDEGVASLVNSLKDNTTLVLLDLAENPKITDASTAVLSHLIQTNSNLTTLCLQKTSLTLESVQWLLKTSTKNRSLTLKV